MDIAMTAFPFVEIVRSSAARPKYLNSTCRFSPYLSELRLFVATSATT